MKPLLFSYEMVRAILAGSKTQTRRIAKIPSDYVIRNEYASGEFIIAQKDIAKNSVKFDAGETLWKDGRVKWFHPKWHKGDVIWVRETWNGIKWKDGSADYWYKADDNSDNPDNKWVPSIFMPKEACRIFLQVENVRVEQLQKITYGDCCAEGAFSESELKCVSDGSRATEAFRKLWDGINAKRGYSWDTNPWVYVIEFKRINKPEDV